VVIARRRHLLVSVALPAVIVAGLVALALGTDRPQSGIDLRVVASRCPDSVAAPACRPVPYRALIQVRKQGRHEIIAGHRPGEDGRIQLTLAPGRYVLIPGPPAPGQPPGRAHPIRARVREDHYTPVEVIYRLTQPGRG
jgi:hypothetical protein